MHRSRQKIAAVGRNRTRCFIALLAALALMGCTSDKAKHIAATTMMGGALGIPGGPIGIAAGAGAGAVAGALIPAKVLDGGRQEASR